MESRVVKFLLSLSLASHVVSSDWPLCSGGSSLLGLNEWNPISLRCCDSFGTCHGYDVESISSDVIDSLQKLLNTTLPIQQSRHKRNFGFSMTRATVDLKDEPIQDTNPLPRSHNVGGDLSSPCCRSKVAVFYPITGFSVTSLKRVAVIQTGPFKQPVVYDQCLQGGCRILRGNCIQVYSPQPLYILTTDEGGKLAAKRDFVLVEAGCQCHSRPLGASSTGTMGVDERVRDALHIITGADFDDDYFAMLAALDAASAIAGPNQAATRPAGIATASTAPVIDPQGTDDDDDAPFANVQMITSSSNSSSLESSHDHGDNEITSMSPTTTKTLASSTTTAAATTTAGVTMEVTTTLPMVTTTVLPLPELPDHDQPILIPSGHFNPVLLSIQKFLNTPMKKV